MIAMYSFVCPRNPKHRWSATRINDDCPFCHARNVRGWTEAEQEDRAA